MRASRLPLAGAALLALGGCGSAGRRPSTPAARSGHVAIAYRNIAISPADVTVRVGSVLTWTNDDNSVEHNVTSGSAAVQAIASPDLRTGQSFSLRVTKPGVISYKCTFHPASMVGRITVVP